VQGHTLGTLNIAGPAGKAPLVDLNFDAASFQAQLNNATVGKGEKVAKLRAGTTLAASVRNGVINLPASVGLGSKPIQIQNGSLSMQLDQVSYDQEGAQKARPTVGGSLFLTATVRADEIDPAKLAGAKIKVDSIDGATVTVKVSLGHFVATPQGHFSLDKVSADVETLTSHMDFDQ